MYRILYLVHTGTVYLVPGTLYDERLFGTAVPGNTFPGGGYDPKYGVL